MNYSKLVLVSSLVFSSVSFAERAAEFNVGGDSVAFGFSTELGSSPFSLSGFGLVGYDDESAFAPTFRWNIIDTQAPALIDNVFIGPTFFITEFKHDQHVNALALSTGGRINLIPRMPIYLSGSASYAPRATTYRDGKNLVSLIGRIEYEYTQKLMGYIGYRDIWSDLEEGSDHAHLTNTAFVGLQYKF